MNLQQRQGRGPAGRLCADREICFSLERSRFVGDREYVPRGKESSAQLPFVVMARLALDLTLFWA